MKKHRIVIATTNKGKIKEINKILSTFEDLQLDLQSLADYVIVEPDEPHDNFLANAIHKAKYYAHHTKEATFSEDSGFCIEALNGAPGVYSKDFIIEHGGVAQAFIQLEQMLANTDNYAAYMHSACAIYFPQTDVLITHEAQVHGTITFPPRGNPGSVDFDPIFIPKGATQTFAELGVEEKIKISHRTNAILGIVEKLRRYFGAA